MKSGSAIDSIVIDGSRISQCIVIYSYNKTNEMHYFTDLFWCRTIHVSDRFTVHHQESSTVHTAKGICHTGYADCLLVLALADSQHNLYDKYLLLCVLY